MFLIIFASTFLIGIRIGSYKYKQPILVTNTQNFHWNKNFIQNLNLLLVDSSNLLPARGLEQLSTKGRWSFYLIDFRYVNFMIIFTNILGNLTPI
jgi:hypothetical protein